MMQWLRYGLALATVGLLSSAAFAQQLKITQIYGGGGLTGATYNRDYVEIFNAGGAPINLQGWSIQYAATTGTTWSGHDLPGDVIPPGGYYLIQMNTTGTVGEPLAADFAPSTSIAMATASGKVALVNSTTRLTGSCPADPTIIDLVGYGTANCFEGSGPTGVALTVTTAAFRREGGCTDTNDNAADFQTLTTAPRNSLTPLNPCPLPPGADLALTVTGPTQSIQLNDQAMFTLVVNNFGPDDATGVQIAATLPPNATLDSSSPPGTLVGDVLTMQLPDVPAGLQSVAFVTLTANAGPFVTVSGVVSGAAADPVADNNTGGASVAVYDRDQALVVIGVDSALGVYAVDVTSGATELLWTGALRGLASDDANRRFFYTTGTQLWTVPYDAPRTPILVGNFNGAVTTISGGLAWDSTRNVLWATTTSSLYEVSPVTARVTLARAFGGGDFGGLDYDPVRDRLVSTNDSTSTANGLQGRGLYLIDPVGAEIFKFADYPIKTGTTQDTDIDGCAYGNGVVYPVADERLWFYRYSESSLSYMDPFETPYGTDQGSSGATFAAELFNQSPGANLGVLVTGPGVCAVAQGGTLTYTVTLRNFGPDAATDVLLTNELPAGTAFLSSDPPLSPVGGSLLYPVGSLPVGATAELTVSVQANVAGVVTVTASASASSPDAFPSNNAAAFATEVQEAIPATAAAKGIFSTLPGSNAVPGVPGIFFDTTPAFDRPVRSYNAQHWVMTADTDDPDTSRDRVLLRGTGTSFNVAAREGITLLSTLEPIGNFDAVVGVNDSGHIAFGTSLGAGSETMVKSDGESLLVVARQGLDVPALFGATYGSISQGATIQNDGTIGFYTNLQGPPTTSDTVWLKDDGNTVIAQEGVTIPSGQFGGATDTWRVLDTGATTGRGMFLSADGSSYLATGMVGPAGAFDLAVVLNGEVVIQESVPLAGSDFTQGVSLIKTAIMEPDGTWFVQGSNFEGASTNGVDWVVRNGAVIAQRDQEIYPGAGINWAEAGFTATYFMATGNRFGDYVVGGLTDSGNTINDAMIVFNRSRILLRENDPIDLDNNGVFDDDAYIHVFRDDFAFLSEDGYFYVAVRLRNGAGICSGSPTEIGQAFLRVRAFCPADWNRDQAVNSTDLSAFITSWLGSINGGGVRSDFNGDGVVNSSDLSAFITAWLSAVQGGC